MTTTTIQVTPEEEQMVLEHREQQKIKKGYNSAIYDVCNALKNMAEQCAGGSGEGGQVYLSLAVKFEKLTRK